MEYKLLSEINSPKDIKKLDYTKLNELSGEIRYKLIETVSENGGHLASNLGMVELTVALHKVFDSPKDQFVYDVGHQCYTHKLLTGRYESFSTLRTKGGISGFTRPTESEHDIFFSGHSATSVSAGLGLAQAKALKGDRSHVVSVIGDGSFTGGMVFEALNNGGRSKANHIVVLNDNKMSISENVGAFAKYLAVIRSRPQYYSFKANTEKVLNKVPFGEKIVKELYKVKTDIKNKVYEKSTFFEDLGYRYMGPIDGHNIESLIECLEYAKDERRPIVLHVCTQKGKGYAPAEKNPTAFHGVGSFNPEDGSMAEKKTSYSSQFGDTLTDIAKSNKNVVAITCAMPEGTGLVNFSKQYKDRFFDVGIAEQHGVTFAAGMATSGLTPVIPLYSTFLQRAFDQALHDVCLQNLHVVFPLDRSGIVGADGETHQGVYDISYLSSMPNMTVLSPSSFRQLDDMLRYAINEHMAPIAIRYPRGSTETGFEYEKFKIGEIIKRTSGTGTVIFTTGRMVKRAEEIYAILSMHGIDATIIEIPTVHPLNRASILKESVDSKHIITIEDNIKSGGMGEHIAEILLSGNIHATFKAFGLPLEPIVHGTVAELDKKYGLDAETIAEYIIEEIKND